MVEDADADTGRLDEPDDFPRLIRPYAITGGRTSADGSTLGLETQIQASTRASAHLGAYRWEAARLVELVRTPMALVEVAARLEIPVGVARVLVADLVTDGAVIVHEPARTGSFTSLLEKVLDGVRAL